MDAATKKLFAVVARLEERLEKLDELEQRLAALDTNGKFEEIKKSMARVEANSQVVVSTVEDHGQVIAKLDKRLERLHLRCPLMKPDTDEFPSVSERVHLKDE